MNITFSSLAFRAGIMSGAALLLSGVNLCAQSNTQSDAFPTYQSYIKISGQAADITGNKAAFQNRVKQPSNGGVGIEDLHLVNDLSKNTSLVVDGKALAGSEDYLGRLNVTNSKVGSVDVGYKRFRTFYDGAGGFFPLNKQWLPLSPEDLHVDRSKLWLEASLNLPDAPVFTLRYTNEQRTGRKDSTIWGSTDLTGLAFNLAPIPITPARKLVPSYINIGERHENLELTVKHTIMNTNLQLTLLGDRTNNSDTRYSTNYPGEVIPWSIASLASAAQPAAKAAVAAANWNNLQTLSTLEGGKTQTTGINAEAETVFNENITLRVGGIYELVHTTDTGDRTIVTSTPTATGVVIVATDNNQGLAGSSRLKEMAGNVRLDIKPAPSLLLKVGLRLGSEWIDGRTYYNAIAASGTPAITLAATPRTGWSRIQQNVQTPEWDLRYTGIKGLSVYFTGNVRNLTGHERNTSAYNYLTAANGTLATNNLKEDHTNITLGANWQVSPALSLRAEVFTKKHDFTSAGYDTRQGDYYLLDLKSTGYKITALAKPTPMLGFTTRFVAQHNDGQVTGFLPTYPAYDSLRGRNYMISESIDWTPTTQVYFQLTGTVTYNTISTIYPRAGWTPATATVNAWDTNKVLQDANGNNVTAGFLTGFVIDRDTDAQVQVTYYRADNGNAVLATTTMPFGVAVKDNTITVGLKHRFSDKWIARGKVGYFDSANDTTGGMTNYHGPMAYLSLEHAL